MKFSLLLFILSLKLRITRLFSSDFRKRLRQKDFMIVIRTDQNGRARTFRFRRGKIHSRFGRNSNADTELVWCNPDTAVRIMLSKNELDGFSAIGRAQLRILGNFEYALRFMDLAE